MNLRPKAKEFDSIWKQTAYSDRPSVPTENPSVTMLPAANKIIAMELSVSHKRCLGCSKGTIKAVTLSVNTLIYLYLEHSDVAALPTVRTYNSFAFKSNAW